MTTKRIVINPDEPNAGDNAYQFYDRSHPVSGRPAVIARMRKEFRGLRGKRVTLTVKGEIIDPDTREHKPFSVRRQRVVKTYRDILGPGSMYATAIKAIRQKNSDWQIVVFSLTLTYTDEGDE